MDTVSYDPFGDPFHSTGSFDPQVRYQADLTDPVTGHVWMGARWYDGGWANFLSRDTVFGELTTPVSLNRYTYAFANPLTYWDPDGRFAGTVQHDFGGAAPQKKTSKTATNRFLEANTDPAPNKKTKPASARAETTVLTQNNRQGNPTSRGLFGEAGRQVGGFFYGFGSGLWGAAKGVGELAGMAYRSSPLHRSINLASYQKQWEANLGLAGAFATNPGMFVGDAINQSLVEVGTPWHQGKQGETIGRSAAVALEILVGGKTLQQIAQSTKAGFGNVLDGPATAAADDVLRLKADESWGRLGQLDNHFRRHGADFGSTTADDYAVRASEFFQRAQQQGLPTRIDAEGVIRIYDPVTNTFGSFNASGTTRTFFTPKRGLEYWLEQPGIPPWSPGS